MILPYKKYVRMQTQYMMYVVIGVELHMTDFKWGFFTGNSASE